jgi:hypothetical protein
MRPSLVLFDPPKPDIVKTIGGLKDLGVSLKIITGATTWSRPASVIRWAYPIHASSPGRISAR